MVACACGRQARVASKHPQRPTCDDCLMTTVILILLVVWLVLAILGAISEGLFWLTIVAVVLLIGTGVYGWLKRKTPTSEGNRLGRPKVADRRTLDKLVGPSPFAASPSRYTRFQRRTHG